MTSLKDVLHFPLLRFGNHDFALIDLIAFIFSLFLAYFLARFVRWLFVHRVVEQRYNPAFRYAMGRILSYVIFLLAFFVGMDVLGIDLSSFTFLVGALGVGIGFGLQNVVNNFVSGLILLAEREVQIHDRITVGSISGVVTHIGARSTRVMTMENLLVIIPNGEFISKEVMRWGRGEVETPRILFMQFGLTYSANVALARQLLLEIVKSHPDVIAQPEPAVLIQDLADHCLNLRLSFGTVTRIFQDAALRSEIYEKALATFEAHGIEMAMPRYAIELKKDEN